ncbi:MAG TPA: chemotaxis-specific protein-glutamate methyltransferase CheB [Terracidiphilus sp.]|nr:chemotaxis-specific protein-glutamate methyltransferase CheB [Terracidiphilus sp.]
MSAAPRKRVLIVDDSAVMRSLLRSVVSSDSALEVVGTAADGRSALGIVPSLRPDLIVLDVEMPVMDGVVALRKLRESGNHVPVIMCSSLTQRGARVTIDALACGASDYVTKPAGTNGVDASTRILARDLLPRIHALTTAIPDAFASATRTVRQGQARSDNAASACDPEVIVIGVSTGGPAALDLLLPSLPSTFPLPLLVVQHMPELFTRQLAARLDQHCALRVREAADGDAVAAGTIYIARGNWHLKVVADQRAKSSRKLQLAQSAEVNHCRPAVDVLFRSAVDLYGASVIAVVLTGMGSDGLAGARAVRTAGGIVLAQDQATSAVWGMPGAVAGAGLANRVLPLEAIAPEILKIVENPSPSAAQHLITKAAVS